MEERQLCDCIDGTTGVVSRVEGDSSTTNRLRELGLLPGQTIHVLQGGSSLHLQLDDTRLCLRAEHLKGICVRTGWEAWNGAGVNLSGLEEALR